MIIRPLDTKEKAAYDAATTHPLQSWDWGEFRRKTGVDTERYGFFDGSKIIGGMQVTFHKIPYTPYTAGYFPKGSMPTQEQMAALKDLGRRKKAIYIKLEPNVAAPTTSPNAFTAIHKFLEEYGAVPGRPLFTRYTFYLDLTQSEEKLLENMKPKTRYNMHLAERKGVQIYEDTTEQGINEYLTIQKETTKRQGFYAHDEKYFRTMWEALKGTGMMRIFKAVYEDQTLVVWIVFIHNGVMYYPYGASSSAHRDVMASNLMMWKIIQFGKDLGCRMFDMWGALGPNAAENRKSSGGAKTTGSHTYAVGRRKTASARVRLSRGSTGFVVNGKPATEYFKTVDPSGALLAVPFKVIAKEGYSATVKVSGSGLHAQLDAVIHGISRALVTVDLEHKPALRKAGLLTRDDRMRQSRNMGTGGKARRQKQSPKR